MRPRRSQTGIKIEIVNMFTFDRYENHKIFNLFPLPGNFLFYQGYSRDWFEMYLCLHSSQSEFMPVSQRIVSPAESVPLDTIR